MDDKNENEIKEEITHDMVIPCKSCQKDFVWSANEQRYYQKKGFKKKPQRCDSCRDKTNELRKENMFYVHCSFCDKDAKMLVPPPKDRVGICEECFKKLSKDPSSLRS